MNDGKKWNRDEHLSEDLPLYPLQTRLRRFQKTDGTVGFGEDPGSVVLKRGWRGSAIPVT